ncbi:hypothetical protein ACMDCR_16255 [Labrys okinawensis]|uniref:hypothetical protein n=1 Tax=Labrys okinawensis TaxID=346911 RepID=UPI0039BC2D40
MKMVILRGKAGTYALPGEKPREWPRGALDEAAALDFARLRGYEPKVIDVAGWSAVNSQQMRMAMKEIRADDDVFALYGFSAGGYTIYNILNALKPKEKDRLALVVVLGAPPDPTPFKEDYRGPWELIYRLNPPAGHMAGPRVLLERPFGPD